MLVVAKQLGELALKSERRLGEVCAHALEQGASYRAAEHGGLGKARAGDAVAAGIEGPMVAKHEHAQRLEQQRPGLHASASVLHCP